MTRIANIDGRLKVVRPDGLVDVQTASNGTFSSDTQAIYERWDEFVAWAQTAVDPTEPLVEEGPRFGPTVPRPPQIFALGESYWEHADLFALLPPADGASAVFTKLPSSIAGPYEDLKLSSDTVIDEVEIGIVFAKETYKVEPADVPAHIAGYTVTLDISDLDAGAVVWRTRWGGPGLTYGNFAKDREGYTPVGPYLVTPDEVDLSDINVDSEVNGVPKFRGNTTDLVLPFADVISYISQRVRILPGDLLSSGAPARLIDKHADLRSEGLKPGDYITARVGNLGEQRKRVVAGDWAKV